MEKLMGYLAYKTQCKSKNKSLGMWKAKVDLFFTYALWHITPTGTHSLLTRTPRSITRNPDPALMMDHTRNFTSPHHRGSSGSILYIRVPKGHKNTASQDPGVYQASGMISETQITSP